MLVVGGVPSARPSGLHQARSSSPETPGGAPLPLRPVSMMKCLPPSSADSVVPVLQEIGRGLVVRDVERKAVGQIDPGRLQARRHVRCRNPGRVTGVDVDGGAGQRGQLLDGVVNHRDPFLLLVGLEALGQERQAVGLEHHDTARRDPTPAATLSIHLR